MITQIPLGYVATSDGGFTHPSKVIRKGSQSAPTPPTSHPVVQKVSEQPKRIRQRVKPLMNRLEQRFFDHLCQAHKPLYAQSITFKIANGLRYTPDVFCFEWHWQGDDRPVAWEVKGPWMTDDAVVKLKVFAAAYPNILVLLVWEDKATGQWLNQIVYP